MKFRYPMINLFVALVLIVTAFANAQPSQRVAAISNSIVISQIYGAGSNTGAVYQNDYVELFNRGSAPASVDGWSIQYASATGTGNFVANGVTALSGLIAPGQYYLVKLAGGTTNGVPLPLAADVTGSLNLSGSAGKVILASTATGLACNGGSTTCTSDQLALIVDLVGYGTANFFETAPAPALTVTTALFRNSNGCAETDNNSADFTAAAPLPRNTTSLYNPCAEATPSVMSTAPAAIATGVDIGTNISVTFTEAVNVAGSWFSISCATSGAHNAAVTGGPIIFGLNPDTDFVSNELCTVTVLAAQVTDQDLVDPPDNLAADYIWSFTTADPAPTVTAVTPVNNAYPVALNANLTVTFSEPVDVTGAWYAISCTSGVHAATVTGGPTAFTLDPDVDFSLGDVCTITLENTLITDQDTVDPFNEMAADYSWSFSVVACGTPATFIHEIQGNGDTSPMAALVKTFEGIVVADYQATGKLNGFFVQEENGDVDADPATSEGVFVYNTSFPVNAGDVVRVTGTVVEFINTSYGQMARMTEISPVTSLEVCATGQTLPAPVGIDLPNVADDGFKLERFEGMLVSFPETLTVQQNYFQARFGQLTLGAGGRIPQMNNITKGGGSIDDYTRMLILDDGSTAQNLDVMSYYPTYGALRAGDTTAASLVGVLDQGRINSTNSTADTRFPNIYYRLHPTVTPTFTLSNPRPVDVPNVGGRLKVVGTNVLNYFTTIDCGNPDADCSYDVTSGYAAYPNTPRGADSATEFTRQQAKIVKALALENADVYGLMEIESWDGAAAPQALVNALNTYLAAQGSSAVYAAVADPALGYFQAVDGGDYIQVALIYKTNTVKPVGASLSTNNTIFSRSPFAQEFEEIATGEQFVVVTNHLKSKGSCPTDGSLNEDQLDGQGCWNLLRVQQAEALLTFINTSLVPLDEDVLVIGDLNAYGAEDPVATLTAGGLINQIAALVPEADRYTYVFDGSAGYLDHALSTAAVSAEITDVAIWHINADEPSVIDYNTEYKDPAASPSSPDFYQADPYRSSDHDAVIIGLELANTANDAPILVNPIPDQRIEPGDLYTYTFPANTFTDPDLPFGDELAYDVTQQDGSMLPAWLTFNPLTRTFSGTPSLADTGTLHIKVVAMDKSWATAYDVFDLKVYLVYFMPVIYN